jgi:hypothetical protein
VGFLRGSAPVIVMDVSGTMNPKQQGRFREMKRCAAELLSSEGKARACAWHRRPVPVAHRPGLSLYRFAFVCSA